MNYQECTVEELVEHVMRKSKQAITQQLMYYQKKGNTEVVVKIKKARMLAKQKKLLADMEALDEGL